MLEQLWSPPIGQCVIAINVFWPLHKWTTSISYADCCRSTIVGFSVGGFQSLQFLLFAKQTPSTSSVRTTVWHNTVAAPPAYITTHELHAHSACYGLSGYPNGETLQYDAQDMSANLAHPARCSKCAWFGGTDIYPRSPQYRPKFNSQITHVYCFGQPGGRTLSVIGAMT